MKKTQAFVTLLLLLIHVTSQAQYSFSGNVTATATVQTVMVLSITNNASTSMTLTNAAYSNGYTINNFNTVAIKSTAAWNLSVAAATPYFSASGADASANMPASVIGLVKSGQSPTIQLSTTPQLLASGTRGNTSQSGNTFAMNFIATPGYTYGAGIYSLTIAYTLTAQ